MMLATAVLLAGCVHDTDDFNLFVADRGASLTYYIGSDERGELDPWERINEALADGFLNYGYKEGHEDPWSRIESLLLTEAVDTGKGNKGCFLGFEKSGAVFVSFGCEAPRADWARVVEVRGRVLRLAFADGVEQYVIDGPATWTEGVQLETEFLGAAGKDDCPFLGVRVWRMVEGDAWCSVSTNLLDSRSFLVSKSPPAVKSLPAPEGGVVVLDTVNGALVWPDPWSRIGDYSLPNY